MNFVLQIGSGDVNNVSLIKKGKVRYYNYEPLFNIYT